MRHRYAVALSIVAGFGLGVVAATTLRSQAAPPAYFVTLFDTESESEVMNTDYPSLAPATFQPFGGHYIIHSGRTITFDGQPPERIVVIAFDNMGKLQGWHASAAFKQLYDIHKIAKVRSFAVEGVANSSIGSVGE